MSQSMVPLPRVLTPQDVSDYLQVPVATLYAWRTRHMGPPAYRVGKHLRYRAVDVDSWLSTQSTPGSAA